MNSNRWMRASHNRGESGQALVFMLLAFGLFLIGAVAFCVDMGNIWFHRQAAQTAADAACTAGAMDLLVDNVNGITTQGGFTAGTAFDCNANPTYAPCKYAAKNGYSSSISATSTSVGNNVSVGFPTAVTGVPGTSSSFPPAALAPNPFMRVDVLDNVQTYFSGLLSGRSAQPVRAFAVCGVVLAKSPIPIIVLNPQVATSLSVQGTPAINIIGGGNRSVQVNSCSTTAGTSPCGTANAVNVGGSASINLCAAGNNFCGANMGIWGAESKPGGFVTDCTSSRPAGAPSCSSQQTPQWNSPSSPIDDPFAQVAAPAKPDPLTTPAAPADVAVAPYNCTHAKILAGNCNIGYHNTTHGCPDAGGCVLYTPGYYPAAITCGSAGTVGICVKNGTSVFDPGIYWLDGGLALQANSFVRPNTGTTAGDGGTMFYFHGTGTVSVNSNSGKVKMGGTAVDGFAIDTTTGLPVKCPAPAGVAPSPALPASIGGNILLAPCSASGTFGDPAGAKFRGILFFQDRSAGTTGSPVQPNWGGGGQFLLAGTLYFHQCVATGSDTGQNCTPSSAFNTNLSLTGNASSGTYVLGEIITDKLTLGGTSGINMQLNPNATFNILKATLLR